MNKYAVEFAVIFERPPETMIGESIFDGEGNHIGWIADAVERPDEPDEATMLKLHSRMNAALLDMQEELLAYHPQDRENASSKELIDCVIRAHQIIEDAATAGVGTCHYHPDDAGFTWWDENDVEHYEEDSASYECGSASCDKCGSPMMVGDDGWFDGWDEITEWTEEDGSEHKGYVLKPRFKFCPKCGKRIEEVTE